MNRFRLHLIVREQPVTREVELSSEQPIVDILNWLEDEYEFRANLKEVWLLQANGDQEQIY